MPRALILDFGEVLVRSQPPAVIAEMAALADLDVDEFRRRYWEHRRAYDSGLPADDYWRRVVDGAPLTHPIGLASRTPTRVPGRTIASRCGRWRLRSGATARGLPFSP